MSNATMVSARMRIESILDDSSFVEIGAGVKARATDFNIQEKAALSDGVITGYGMINNKPVYIYSQDATVMNGTVGEMHAKKIAALYDMAVKMGAPVIGLIDCAGIRLQESTDALAGFGTIYQKMSMASGVVPQITAVYGNCGGGLAVLTALSDFTFMEEKNGKFFVNSPNALDGNYAEKLDTTTAEFAAKAGTVDFAGDEETVAGGIRQLVDMLPCNNECDTWEQCEDDLNRTCPDMAAEIADASMALADIADGNVFVEVKQAFAKDMVTGFIKLDGTTVGCVANRTAVFDENGEKAEEFAPVISVKGARKAAEFVEFCDAFNIPVLTLTNVKGFEANVCAEKHIAKAVAKLTYAFANATVPKINVITGEAYGSAYVAMNSKAIGADMTYAWDTASIGMMDANLAAKIMYADDIAKAEDVTAEISAKAAEYAALQSSVESAAARGYVDTVINASDTRKYVAAAFEMLFSKREKHPEKKHGTV